MFLDIFLRYTFELADIEFHFFKFFHSLIIAISEEHEQVYLFDVRTKLLYGTPYTMTRSKQKNYWLLGTVFVLALCVAYLFYLDYKSRARDLTFAMLDVGQGDALFIESPTGTQILFDSGPPRKILGQLRKVMSPFDKSIDAIVITNPDADHIGGFAEILKNYKVGRVFEPGTLNDSKTYQNLKAEIAKQNIPDILARAGMKLDLGEGTIIEILFPDRNVVGWSANDGSVVARLTYRENKILLTGDSTAKTEKMLLKNYDTTILDSDILKVGHHGSRSSTIVDFVRAVSPAFALISVGKENKYGHPHRETLETLDSVKAQVLRTDQVGNIIVHSDGTVLRWQYELR